jgi:hypothetical protein
VPLVCCLHLLCPSSLSPWLAAPSSAVGATQPAVPVCPLSTVAIWPDLLHPCAPHLLSPLNLPSYTPFPLSLLPAAPSSAVDATRPATTCTPHPPSNMLWPCAPCLLPDLLWLCAPHLLSPLNPTGLLPLSLTCKSHCSLARANPCASAAAATAIGLIIAASTPSTLTAAMAPHLFLPPYITTCCPCAPRLLPPCDRLAAARNLLLLAYNSH